VQTASIVLLSQVVHWGIATSQTKHLFPFKKKVGLHLVQTTSFAGLLQVWHYATDSEQATHFPLSFSR